MSEQYGGQEQGPQEIERKFLVRKFPAELKKYRHEQIRQGYLVIGSDGSEARLRDRDGAYTLTIKSRGEMVRGEWEAPISAEQFETWWPATSGKRVEKVRYSIPYDEHMIELDVYQGSLAGLAVAEVEFDSTAGAYAFGVPEWLGWEVTDSVSYKNQNLALNGIPPDFTG